MNTIRAYNNITCVLIILIKKKKFFQNFTFVPSLKVTVASFSVCSKFWAFFSRVISIFSRPCNSLYKLLSRISLRMKEKWPSRTVPLTKSSKFRFETFFPLTWTDWWMVSPSLFYLGSKYAKLLDTKNFEGKWKSSNHQNIDPKVRARLGLDNVRVRSGSPIIILNLSAMCGRPREHQDRGRHHSPRYPLRSDSKLSQIARISSPFIIFMVFRRIKKQAHLPTFLLQRNCSCLTGYAHTNDDCFFWLIFLHTISHPGGVRYY